MAKASKSGADEQPLEPPAVTFTFDNMLYGVDKQGRIWRHNRLAWDLTGAEIPPVAPTAAPTKTKESAS